MGYFANGTEGDIFQERFCERCVRWQKWEPGATGVESCPVMDLQRKWNRDQYTFPTRKQILDLFIKRTNDGQDNECQMFVERAQENAPHD